jgi:hypothetical protein
MSSYLVEVEILLNPCLEQVCKVWSVRVLDEYNVKRLFTEALSELGTGILSERRKWASINLLVRRLHAEHSLGTAVTLLG